MYGNGVLIGMVRIITAKALVTTRRVLTEAALSQSRECNAAVAGVGMPRTQHGRTGFGSVAIQTAGTTATGFVLLFPPDNIC